MCPISGMLNLKWSLPHCALSFHRIALRGYTQAVRKWRNVYRFKMLVSLQLSFYCKYSFIRYTDLMCSSSSKLFDKIACFFKCVTFTMVCSKQVALDWLLLSFSLGYQFHIISITFTQFQSLSHSVGKGTGV